MTFRVGNPAAGSELNPGTPPDFAIEIYRLGYYNGDGARLVATIPASATTEADPPACLVEPATGLVDCGNWPAAATWSVPAAAVSGVYIARLARVDNGAASHIAFVVRNDARTANLFFQTSDTTWQVRTNKRKKKTKREK